MKRILSLVTAGLIVISSVSMSFASTVYPITPPPSPPSKPISPPPSPGAPTTPSVDSINLPKGPKVYEDGTTSIFHYKDITGYDEKTDISANTDITYSGGNVYVDVDVDLRQKLKNVSNTVVLDLAKFSFRGLPYEMNLMRDLMIHTPEHYYGDIIHIEEQPLTSDTSGMRKYLPFEKQLVEEGIARHRNDITYIEGKGVFSVQRDVSLNIPHDEKMTRTEFLSTLGRVNGVNDSVLAVAQSSAVAIPHTDMTSNQVQGRELIDTSPYLKHVTNGITDIGQNIVLVDYNNGEYITMRLDNINKPYINYLLDINVISKDEIKGQDEDKGNNQTNGPILSDIIRNSSPKMKDIERINYSTINVSTPPKNTDSNKDWGWEGQITKSSTGNVSESNFTNYNLTDEYEITKAELIKGKTPEEDRLKTTYAHKIPNFMENEKLTEIDALGYIYKYLIYNEKEISLNQMEVDTIVSLYGLELSKYNAEEVNMLKYLIVKGIVDPIQDNLLNLREGMLYENMLKYIFRLKYEDKRFDFKNLTITMQDVEMAKQGYMQDEFVFRTSIDKDLEKAKSDAFQEASKILESRGNDNIYIELPTETINYTNHILTDSKEYDITFRMVPIKRGQKIYGYATIPKNYKGSIVLRSTNVGDTEVIKLDKWEPNTVYNISSDRKTYEGVYRDTSKLDIEDTLNIVTSVDMFRMLATTEGKGNAKFLIDESRKSAYLYNRENLFTEEGELAPKFKEEGKLEYEKGYLIIKDIQDMSDASRVLNNLDIPAALSDKDVTFGGYSQIISNGKKLSLVRDMEMNKLGIELLEDNVLYNPVLDTYAYLDMRTDTLYYGNTIIRYEPGTMMMDAVEGQEAVFYNLDVVRTLLTKPQSNNSISNEIITLLPNDERYELFDGKQNSLDNIYMHKDNIVNSASDDGSYWLNVATLGGKNSNYIYFRDRANGDFAMLINYRAKRNSEEKIKEEIKSGKVEMNDSSFTKLMDNLKGDKLRIHQGINPVFQSIMKYNGNFTDERYNYGLTLLYPEEKGSSVSSNEYVRNETQLAFYQLQNMFTNSNDLNKFILHFGNTGGLPKFKMVSTDGSTQETLQEAMDRVKGDVLYRNFERSPGDIHIGMLEYGEGSTSVAPNLSVKIDNNNLYLRYKVFKSMSDISKDSKDPYFALGKLRYLYMADHKLREGHDSKRMLVREIDPLYTRTPKGHVPLEHWSDLRAINPSWTKEDVAMLRLTIDNKQSPYMFDRVKHRNPDNDAYQFHYKSEKKLSHSKTLLAMYEEIKNLFPEYKEAMESSFLDKKLISDTDALREYLSKTIVGTDGGLVYERKGRGFLNFTRGLITESNLNKRDKNGVYTFNFEKNKVYVYDLQFLIPSGTMLVNVGQQALESGKYLTEEGDYKLAPIPNDIVRVENWEINDIVNQSIARIFDTESIKEIKEGSVLRMPSGLKLVSLGNSKFFSTIGEELGKGLESEEILMWKYLDQLNQRVGLNSNVMNGILNIAIPTVSEYENRGETSLPSLTKDWVDIENKNVVYTADNNLKTGKFGNTLGDDKKLNPKSMMYPIITLDNEIAVARIYEDHNGVKHYIMKDLSMSVDQGFVDYLRAGIAKISNTKLGNAGLEDFLMDDTEVEQFRRRNLALIIGRFISIVMYILPWILIVYGSLSGGFILLMSIATVRDALEYWLPEWIFYKVIRVFTMFTSTPEEEIYLWEGIIKSSIVTAIGILWLSYVYTKYM